MTTSDPVHGPPGDASAVDGGFSRRRFVGSALAVGAAIVWTSEFPFADAAIGQTLRPALGPTGPTGPGGPTGPSGPTGSTGTGGSTGAGGSGGTGSAGTVPSGSIGSAGASGSSGTTGTSQPLAVTGSDLGLLAAAGAASVAVGGAIVWWRGRAAEEQRAQLADGSEDSAES